LFDDLPRDFIGFPLQARGNDKLSRWNFAPPLE